MLILKKGLTVWGAFSEELGRQCAISIPARNFDLIAVRGA